MENFISAASALGLEPCEVVPLSPSSPEGFNDDQEDIVESTSVAAVDTKGDEDAVIEVGDIIQRHSTESPCSTPSRSPSSTPVDNKPPLPSPFGDRGSDASFSISDDIESNDELDSTSASTSSSIEDQENGASLMSPSSHFDIHLPDQSSVSTSDSATSIARQRDLTADKIFSHAEELLSLLKKILSQTSIHAGEGITLLQDCIKKSTQHCRCGSELMRTVEYRLISMEQDTKRVSVILKENIALTEKWSTTFRCFTDSINLESALKPLCLSSSEPQLLSPQITVSSSQADSSYISFTASESGNAFSATSGPLTSPPRILEDENPAYTPIIDISDDTSPSIPPVTPSYEAMDVSHPKRPNFHSTGLPPSLPFPPYNTVDYERHHYVNRPLPLAPPLGTPSGPSLELNTSRPIGPAQNTFNLRSKPSHPLSYSQHANFLPLSPPLPPRQPHGSAAHSTGARDHFFSAPYFLPPRETVFPVATPNPLTSLSSLAERPPMPFTSTPSSSSSRGEKRRQASGSFPELVRRLTGQHSSPVRIPAPSAGNAPITVPSAPNGPLATVNNKGVLAFPDGLLVHNVIIVNFVVFILKSFPFILILILILYLFFSLIGKDWQSHDGHSERPLSCPVYRVGSYLLY